MLRTEVTRVGREAPWAVGSPGRIEALFSVLSSWVGVVDGNTIGVFNHISHRRETKVTRQTV